MNINNEQKKYMNPYLAGFLLGLVLLLTIFITGRGLGASGAFKSVVVAGVQTVTPSYANDAAFFKHYIDSYTGSVLKSWLVFEVIGVIIGGFLSGLIANRLKFKVEHPAQVPINIRLVGAVIGGALFGLGSQLGRGCTSGSALSGMAVLSLQGFIVMMAIFGSAYAFAYFFRKLWY